MEDLKFCCPKPRKKKRRAVRPEIKTSPSKAGGQETDLEDQELKIEDMERAEEGSEGQESEKAGGGSSLDSVRPAPLAGTDGRRRKAKKSVNPEEMFQVDEAELEGRERPKTPWYTVHTSPFRKRDFVDRGSVDLPPPDPG